MFDGQGSDDAPPTPPPGASRAPDARRERGHSICPLRLRRGVRAGANEPPTTLARHRQETAPTSTSTGAMPLTRYTEWAFILLRCGEGRNLRPDLVADSIRSAPVSKPIQAINRYKADLREISFLLFEQFKLGELLGQGAVRGLGRGRGQERRSTRPTASRARCSGRSTPSATARAAGSRTARSSRRPASRTRGRSSTRRAGRRSRVARSTAAQGAPAHAAGARRGDALRRQHRLQHVPGPRATARPRSSSSSARREQKKLYCERMFNGKWGGTMCLTEPHAGSRRRRGAAPRATKQRRRHLHDHAAPRSSSPAAITTSPRTSSTSCSRASTARRRAPRASRSSSCPSSASTPTARSGEPNDVTVGAIEHKMGINGSATCVLNFGENGELRRRARSATRRATRACRRCSR